MTHWTRRTMLRKLGSGIALAAAGCLGSGPDPEARVEKHRSELEGYGDVATAMKSGYRTLARYVETDGGVLGEPLMRRRSGKLSETEPDIVLFDFADDGTYQPLALKWYVHAENTDGPPSLFGRSFDGPIESQTGFLPRHYYLHVWLFRENPDGLFARYNPAVEPPAFLEDLTTARNALYPYVKSSRARKSGYENLETCVRGGDGVYGVPYVGDLGGGTDLTDPPILRYRLGSTWTYRLLGTEWFVPVEEANEPPMLFGQRFHEPMPGHLPGSGQQRHYGLHAWLFRSNPRGLFAPYNPAITC